MLVLVVMLFLVNNVLSKVAKKELKLLENTKAITMESLLKSILNFSSAIFLLLASAYFVYGF
jgi:hypothetical protein